MEDRSMDFSVTDYVCTLPRNVQRSIIEMLRKSGLEAPNIIVAMNSRLCDLEDAIDVSAIMAYCSSNNNNNNKGGK